MKKKEEKILCEQIDNVRGLRQQKVRFIENEYFLIFFNSDSDEILKYIFTVVHTMLPTSDISVFYDRNGDAACVYVF